MRLHFLSTARFWMACFVYFFLGAASAAQQTAPVESEGRLGLQNPVVLIFVLLAAALLVAVLVSVVIFRLRGGENPPMSPTPPAA